MKFVTRVKIHHRIFAGIVSFSKTSKNFLWWSHFLIKTEDYSLLTQNSTKNCHRWFHEAVLKQLHQNKIGKHPDKLNLFSLNANLQIQSTAYYRTKRSTTDKFRKVLKEKKLFKKFKNSQNFFANFYLFSER